MTGLELKEIRESLHWTQERLAEESGVSKRTIINWEQSEDLPEQKVKLLQSIFENFAPNKNNNLNETGAVYKKENTVNLNKEIIELKTLEEVVDFIIKHEDEAMKLNSFKYWIKDKINNNYNERLRQMILEELEKKKNG